VARRPSGQAIVEFALVFPIMCFAALGFVEAGFLIVEKAQQDRSTAVVAEWAAENPGNEGWNAVANTELPGCAVTVTTTPKDIVIAAATCQYEPKVTVGLWPGLVIGSTESAAIRSAVPVPSPS
jgi:hypothetical protein